MLSRVLSQREAGRPIADHARSNSGRRDMWLLIGRGSKWNSTVHLFVALLFLQVPTGELSLIVRPIGPDAPLELRRQRHTEQIEPAQVTRRWDVIRTPQPNNLHPSPATLRYRARATG